MVKKVSHTSAVQFSRATKCENLLVTICCPSFLFPEAVMRGSSRRCWSSAIRGHPRSNRLLRQSSGPQEGSAPSEAGSGSTRRRQPPPSPRGGPPWQRNASLQPWNYSKTNVIKVNVELLMGLTFRLISSIQVNETKND